MTTEPNGGPSRHSLDLLAMIGFGSRSEADCGFPHPVPSGPFGML